MGKAWVGSRPGLLPRTEYELLISPISTPLFPQAGNNEQRPGSLSGIRREVLQSR